MNYNNVSFYTSFGLVNQLPSSDKIEIVFSGRSNVGKSSMINKVFNRKNLARVSAQPGKTVTINFFEVENVYFVDLPGYGYAKKSFSEKKRWADLMEGYFNSGRNIGLVCCLIDMRHPATTDDIMMINYLIDSEFPFIIVFTKCDKLSKKQQNERLADFSKQITYLEDINYVVFSSETGEGVDELRKIFDEISVED